MGEIVLDIPETFTYHTQAFTTSFAVKLMNFSRQLAERGGADSHDE